MSFILKSYEVGRSASSWFSFLKSLNHSLTEAVIFENTKKNIRLCTQSAAIFKIKQSFLNTSTQRCGSDNKVNKGALRLLLLNERVSKVFHKYFIYCS